MKAKKNYGGLKLIVIKIWGQEQISCNILPYILTTNFS